jgi:magnesium chelatase subunit H
MRFIFLTMDGNHGAALRQAAADLSREQGLELALSIYTVNSLRSEADWQRLEADMAGASFVFGAMLFSEEIVRPLQRLLGGLETPVCVITSNPALIRMTRLGKFTLGQREDESGGGFLMQLARKFRPRHGAGEGQRQLALLRNLGKVMKHIPGKARDLHSYIAVHEYWMNSSPENLKRMLCLLIERYVPGYAGKLPQDDAISYPSAAIYHPDAPQPFPDLVSYEKWRAKRAKGGKSRAQAAAQPNSQGKAGSVGVLSLRTVILSGNTAHLDALIRSLEAEGVEARAAYSANLDFRPAIEQFFSLPQTGEGKPQGFWPFARKQASGPQQSQQATVDLLVNGAGFSLIGGMAESRPDEARVALEGLDVGYLDMIPLAFQRVEDWRADDSGLSPIQLAMNVAVPELDGATDPIVIGGPTAGQDAFVALEAQVRHAALRIARRVKLRRTPPAERKVGVVLFNFPPNLGNIGTAAYLDVFESLFHLMQGLKAEGYDVDLPADADTLRKALVEGNTLQYGTNGNLHARFPVADYMRLFPEYRDIEPFWGKAPGELLNDGRHFFILGRQFGKLFVGLQPSFGYERDPMRLLMAKDAAPHHGFAAFYTWLEQVFGADALIHFGTHGALEFMPGKQAGLSEVCWPQRLIGSLPNVYYYSVNNPSEGTIAKRRGLATLVSYMVPPLQQAGLYKGLRLLKDSLDTYRQHSSAGLLEDIRAQAEKLTLVPEDPGETDEEYVAALAHELIQVEQRMIPVGLHVLGAEPSLEALTDVLALVSAFVRPQVGGTGSAQLPPLPQLVARGLGWNYEALQATLLRDRGAQEKWEQINTLVREAMRLFVSKQQPEAADAFLFAEARINPGTLRPLWAYLGDLLGKMLDERELEGLLHALDGGYTAPSPGNDVVRNPAVVPTGRNIHGLDPYRVPTAAAQETGGKLMGEMLERLAKEQGSMPESVAMVLWGTDNLKSDGEGVGQVLSLLGARAVPDELGRIASVELVPLAELGRPRIDVVVTVSGIFRDLLGHQMELMDMAVKLAAAADEPLELNFVRKHALAQAQELGIGLAAAATRVFANAPGSYGANVNHLVESSTWDHEQQLSDAFLARKSFAYGQHGEWHDARDVMEKALSTVGATFQNVDSFELGINDIDHYYEYLGGVTKSVETLSGKRPKVMVADAISTTNRLSSLEQMVRMESRAKLLNPKWFEAMLAHGYEGVHEIEARVSNTYGWSATAQAVEGWVYQGVAETFLLDEAMRERMAKLNPHATAAVARRLLEANDRGFWDADDETLEALQDIYSDLEDRLEGVGLERGGVIGS